MSLESIRHFSQVCILLAVGINTLLEVSFELRMWITLYDRKFWLFFPIQSDWEMSEKHANCIWPTWLMVVYNGMWCWADEGRAVDTLHFDFSRSFDVVCHMVVSLRTGWVDHRIGGKLSWLLAIRSRDQQLKVQLIAGFQWHTSAADTAAKTV